MLSSVSVDVLKEQVARLIDDQQEALAMLRRHAAALRADVARIQPRSTTSMSLVGTDGGNNRVQYDPLHLSIVRVVDSGGNEHHLEAVSPNLTVSELDRRQFDSSRRPITALGEMMTYMEADSLSDLCQVFSRERGTERSLSWIGEYRGLHEWAVLFQLVRRKDFGTDTIIVRDGPFREKMFKPGFFRRFRDGLSEGLEDQLKRNRRRLYLVGVLKRSKIFQKYRLALALEATFHTRYPCFACISEEMMHEAFKRWPEWIENTGSAEDFVGGRLFAAKFGNRPYDPVWLIDVFESQAADASRIMSYLLNDALNGFPLPCYPGSLQRAYDAANLADFDMAVIERLIRQGLRASLGSYGEIVDKLAIQEGDAAFGR